MDQTAILTWIGIATVLMGALTTAIIKGIGLWGDIQKAWIQMQQTVNETNSRLKNVQQNVHVIANGSAIHETPNDSPGNSGVSGP